MSEDIEGLPPEVKRARVYPDPNSPLWNWLCDDKENCPDAGTEGIAVLRDAYRAVERHNSEKHPKLA
jgi:hypothetical protein